MPNQSEIKRLLNREPQMIQAAFKKSRERIKDQPLEGAEARQLVRSIAVMVAEVADLPLPRILKFLEPLRGITLTIGNHNDLLQRVDLDIGDAIARLKRGDANGHGTTTILRMLHRKLEQRGKRGR